MQLFRRSSSRDLAMPAETADMEARRDPASVCAATQRLICERRLSL